MPKIGDRFRSTNEPGDDDPMFTSGGRCAPPGEVEPMLSIGDGPPVGEPPTLKIGNPPCEPAVGGEPKPKSGGKLSDSKGGTSGDVDGCNWNNVSMKHRSVSQIPITGQC